MVIASVTQHSAAGLFGQTLVVLAGVAGAVLVVAIGAWRARPGRQSGDPSGALPPGGPIATGWTSLTRTRDTLARRVHPFAVAGLAVLAGLTLALIVTFAVGVATKLGAVVHLDRPLDHFVDRHRVAAVTRLMIAATLLGSYPVSYTIAVVGGLIAGVLSRHWLPLVVLVASVPTEILAQRFTAGLVQGTRPARTLAIGPPGAFFSGGSARILIVCGLLAYFLGWLGLARRQRVMLWTCVALATFIESYSRLYLGRHWAVDIVGGWVAGALLLAAFVFAAEIFRPAAGTEAAAGPRAARRTTASILALTAIVTAAIGTEQWTHGSATQSAPSYREIRSLAPAHGALFGAYVQPRGGFSASDVEAAVTGLERTLGRKLAIDQIYVRWAHPMPLAVARWDLSEGRIPMISWAGTRTDRITAGAYDAQIRARALQLRALRGPVMVRWFAEMDGVQSRPEVVSPESFVAAWRHIHDIFSRAGAANTRWVWCPNAFNFATGYAQKFYPGDAYVDWIGADGYSWAPKRPGARWKDFTEIFSDFYRWGASMGKPLLIGEYGVLERSPGEKAAWFARADRDIRTQFPAIRAVVYFDSDHQNYNWRVTTSVSSLAAFRAFAQDPYFNARPAV